MEDWKADRFGSLERGENPTFLMKMKSGYAVLADSQFLPGYCILLAYPKIGSLNELPMVQRQQFLFDMSLIGDAINTVCHPLRLNYSILANTDPFLHAHIQPRYGWESDEYRPMPAWLYPKDQFYSPQYAFDEKKHDGIKSKLSETLKAQMRKIHY